MFLSLLIGKTVLLHHVPFVYPPFALRHERFKLFSLLLGYFSLLNKLFPRVGLNNPHVNLYLVHEVVPARLQ